MELLEESNEMYDDDVLYPMYRIDEFKEEALEEIELEVEEPQPSASRKKTKKK